MTNKDKLPDWLTNQQKYFPAKSKFSPISFLVKNIKRFSSLNDHIHRQDDEQEIKVINFLIFILELILLSLSQSLIFVWVMLIIFLFKMALRPKKKLILILRHAFISSLGCLVIMLPMVLLNYQALNYLFLLKTFIILIRVNIFVGDLSFTNLIILAQKLHLSESLIFILGIMTKYLKILNNNLLDEMNAIQIKSIGKMKHPYQMIGGIFGTIYLHSVKTSEDVHDAMIARGYTSEFKVKKVQKQKQLSYGWVQGIVVLFLFFLLGR